MSSKGEEILAMKDLTEEKVYVPEWKTHVIIREMTALERYKFEKKLTQDESLLRPLLVAFTAFDPEADDIPLFSIDEAAALAQKSYRAIVRLSNVAMRLSVMGDAELEEVEANFTENQPDG